MVKTYRIRYNGQIIVTQDETLISLITDLAEEIASRRGDIIDYTIEEILLK
jgi:hypothetical protein